MADDANLEPNLELPKLFGRKKRGKTDAVSDEQETESAAPAAPTPAQPAARPAPPAPASPTPVAQPTPRPEEAPPRRPTAPVSAAPEVQSVAQMPDPTASAPTTPTPVVSAPATTQTTQTTQTAPEVAAPAPGRSSGKAKRGLPTVTLPSLPRRKPRETSLDAATGRRSSLPTLPVPQLTGRTAAALTGALVGLGLVLSTVGVLRGCDAIRGTKSCGGAGGFVLLLVLIVLAVYAGAMLLRAFGIPDPGSTSFLAVGIVVVLSMVVFIDSLLDWWMFLLIPTMSAGAYALSHYITTAVVEPAMEQTRDQRVD